MKWILMYVIQKDAQDHWDKEREQIQKSDRKRIKKGIPWDRHFRIRLLKRVNPLSTLPTGLDSSCQ